MTELLETPPETVAVWQRVVDLIARLAQVPASGRVASITGQARSTLIPTVIDQNPCAHLRMPRDMIFHGWSMRLFQAWQHSATMSS